MRKLTRVEERLRARRQRNEKIHAQRLEEVRRNIAGFEKIEAAQRKNGFDLVRFVISKRDIAPLEDKGKSLEEEKARLLKDAGYPADYLDPIYTCPICKDTGLVGTEPCRCKKRMVIEELYDMSGLEDILKYQNFDKFRLDFFRSTKLADEVVSPRDMMEVYLDKAVAYADNYPQVPSKNLLFYGSVGTGKTFMAHAIAKRLMDRGFSLVYQTAPSLMNFIADYNFSSGKDKAQLKDKYDYLIQADLIIIDDLGTEAPTSIVDSNLFELINSRLLLDKGTIISTNLDINGIRETYDDRIYSRLRGSYKLVYFFGDDQRMRKLK